VAVAAAGGAVLDLEAHVAATQRRWQCRALAEEARGGAGQRAHGGAVAGDAIGDAHPDDPRRPAEKRGAHRQAHRGPGAPGGDDDDVRSGQRASAHLRVELEHGVDVPQVGHRVRGAGQDEVRPLRAPVGEDGPQRGHHVAAAVDQVATGPDAAEQGAAREARRRLLEQRRAHREAGGPAEHHRGQHLGGAEAAGGDQRARPARLRLGKQVLVAAHLVAAVHGGDGVVALAPHAVAPQPVGDGAAVVHRGGDMRQRPPRHRARQPGVRGGEPGLGAQRGHRGGQHGGSFYHRTALPLARRSRRRGLAHFA
jgi:hypothetical protein